VSADAIENCIACKVIDNEDSFKELLSMNLHLIQLTIQLRSTIDNESFVQRLTIDLFQRRVEFVWREQGGPAAGGGRSPVCSRQKCDSVNGSAKATYLGQKGSRGMVREQGGTRALAWGVEDQ
jgi:hypothetical protein